MEGMRSTQEEQRHRVKGLAGSTLACLPDKEPKREENRTTCSGGGKMRPVASNDRTASLNSPDIGGVWVSIRKEWVGV